jgi:phospholipid-translocating ATPase
MAAEQGDEPSNPDRRRRRRRRAALRLSKLYSFACGRRPSVADDRTESRIGGPGYSRVVNAGAAALRLQQQQQQRRRQQQELDPDAEQQLAIITGSSNSISTTKYNLLTFLPKSLFEQFRRVANVYFLVTALLTYTPLAPFNSTTAILPLVIVLVATMVKEAVEDWRRKQQVTPILITTTTITVHPPLGFRVESRINRRPVTTTHYVLTVDDEFHPGRTPR